VFNRSYRDKKVVGVFVRFSCAASMAPKHEVRNSMRSLSFEFRYPHDLKVARCGGCQEMIALKPVASCSRMSEHENTTNVKLVAQDLDLYRRYQTQKKRSASPSCQCAQALLVSYWLQASKAQAGHWDLRWTAHFDELASFVC
jgi:hypothetical protein